MRKVLTLFGILIYLISSNTFSQNSKIEFGIKAGANLSTYISGIQYAEYKGKFGFYIGGLANLSISEKFKLQPELLFALQGAALSYEIEIREGIDQEPVVGEFKTNITETTISIPIMAQYYISEKFYFEAGPQIGLIVNHKGKVVKSPTDDPDFNSVPDNVDYDVFDLGLSFGLGLKISENISINSRYFLGLIERNNSKVKSSVINLGAEYRF